MSDEREPETLNCFLTPIKLDLGSGGWEGAAGSFLIWDRKFCFSWWCGIPVQKKLYLLIWLAEGFLLIYLSLPDSSFLSASLSLSPAAFQQRAVSWEQQTEQQAHTFVFDFQSLKACYCAFKVWLCYQIERSTVIGDIKTTHWSQFDSLAETKECPLGNVNIDYRDKSDVQIADDRRSVFSCRGLQRLMMSQEKKRVQFGWWWL